MNDDPSPSSPSAPGGGSKVQGPSYLFLGVVSAVSLVADLATKEWAMNALGSPFKRIRVIDGLLSFVLAQNRGGAWGLLQHEGDHIRRPFFLLISVVAILFIVSLYRRLTPQQFALKWGLPLVLGGAAGNFIDRIRYGHVIDFIDAYAVWGGEEHHWPTFNVADIAICVGVGLMAVDMFTARKPKPAAAPLPPADR
jgi:signal peptidase II